MTLAHPSLLSPVPEALSGVLNAARELRDAKQFLRAGNVIKGVKRHEHAKLALYRELTTWLKTAGLDARPEHQLPEQLGGVMEAGLRFHLACEQYRASGAASGPALALAAAERSLIGQLERLEQLHPHR